MNLCGKRTSHGQIISGIEMDTSENVMIGCREDVKLKIFANTNNLLKKFQTEITKPKYFNDLRSSINFCLQ